MDTIVGIVIALVIVGVIVSKKKPEWIKVIKGWVSKQSMPQLGSDEKPVLMSSKKNKGRLYGPSWHGGKGAAPRVNVHSKQYRDNWDAIFGGKKNAKKEDND